MKLLSFHQFCVSDEASQRYKQAIFQSVKPGDVVVDVGTGTGILAFFAKSAGAERVYGIEPSMMLDLAREVARRNGVQDDVLFIKDFSYNVELPEKADVLVTNTLETFGLQGSMLAVVVDARKRLLKEGAVMIPRALTMYIAPVSLPRHYAKMIDFWKGDVHGYDYTPVRKYAVNSLYAGRVSPDLLLAKPALLKHIDFAEIEEPEVSAEATLVVTKAGIMTDLCGWFSADIADGITVCNEPDSTSTQYNQAILPLNEPVQLEVGEIIHATVQSYNGAQWRWQVEIESRGLKLDQSTMWGTALSLEELHKLSSTYAPRLSANGEIELFLLGQFNGGKTLAEIELELRRRYPDRFKSANAASEFLREAVQRYT